MTTSHETSSASGTCPARSDLPCEHRHGVCGYCGADAPEWTQAVHVLEACERFYIVRCFAPTAARLQAELDRLVESTS